ncbi:MAG: VOC family protein [Pseudomonadota bacterium]
MSATLQSAVPVLRVRDVPAARAFWTDVPGFGMVIDAGDPVTGFGVFCRGGARVLLTARQGADPRVRDTWRNCLHEDDVAALATEIRATGAPIAVGTEPGPDGVREIMLDDPAGNRVAFGQFLPEAA